MKVWEVSIVGCLQDVSFEVNIGHFFNLQHLWLVYLFESENIAMDIDQRDNSVASSSQIMDQLNILLRDLRKFRRLVPGLLACGWGWCRWIVLCVGGIDIFARRILIFNNFFDLISNSCRSWDMHTGSSLFALQVLSDWEVVVIWVLVFVGDCA